MKVIIAGSREFSEYPLLRRTMDEFSQGRGSIIVISGCARGADRLGERWARERGLLVRKLPADWARYGKKAGYIRNLKMAEIADACVVFWDGESRGSKMMIDIAKDKGLELEIVEFKSSG